MRGAWLHLDLVVDVKRQKMLAWDVAEMESADIAADLVQCPDSRSSHTNPVALSMTSAISSH